ncbi:uncharacterized protein LOC106647217 isoform X2 [Copidosoma floridanum]|uniref:uncharacterized protein LOC106647217 isoform X2 n=1 Tax=Copidosoma floridanum TaxID=29053 RepID=UPI0006C94957|nr:uncharacterized protein LOC106647217 isoform X2 [Copidosoma floridanum]XP_014219008.1 uncharacterized protein LOC106647217 isoform X2 [Copidosoma floridanum]
MRSYTLTMFKRGLFYFPVKGFDIRKVSVPMSTSCSIHCDGKDTVKAGSKRMAYEVFLGGSCNPTTWRTDIAIPTLQSLGITYYNPQVSHWSPELIAQEYEAKETARVLLFVIDDRTRNCAGIIEAAELAGTRRDSLIVVVHPYRQGQTIFGEVVSNQEYCELMNGLLVLQCLMDRQRIPIFESISAALNCTSKILRNAVNVQDLHGEDGIRPPRISFGQHGTDVTKLREAFKALDTNLTGTISLAEALMVLQSNGKNNLTVSELRNVVNEADVQDKTMMDKLSSNGEAKEQRINFEQFCAIASEWSWRFKSNGVNCENWTNTIIADSEKKDLYIGVVGKDLVWLESSAVPLVESMNLTLYRPSTNEYIARVLPLELQRMKNSRLIMLVVPQHTRGMAIMALAAHLIGLRAKLVLCVQALPEGCTVSGEKLTEQAIKDYNRGRMYLSDMATREGVPVFDNVSEALQRAIHIVRSPC